jgi:hypothetical protein
MAMALKYPLALLLVVSHVTASTADSVYQRKSACTPTHQASVWGAVLRCEPRPTLVELALPEQVPSGSNSAVMQLVPGHVMANRCAGSCHSPSHSCLATRTRNESVEVMAVRTSFATGGVWTTLCTRVWVEQHLSCACGCAVRPEHCRQDQFYERASCRCQCNRQVARMECLAAGKIWSDSTCACACPQRTWRSCSTGFSFDYERSCACVRVSLMASSGVVAAVAAAVLALGAILIAVIEMRRRRRHYVAIESRRSSVRRNLAEAMAEEDQKDG